MIRQTAPPSRGGPRTGRQPAGHTVVHVPSVGVLHGQYGGGVGGLSAQRAGRGAAVVLGGAALFQVGLAAGAPWGAAAWGGRRQGTLPAGLRAASGGSAVMLGAIAALAASPDPAHPILRTRMLRGSAAYLAVGALANAASRSPVERWWAPVNAVGAVLLWRATTSP